MTPTLTAEQAAALAKLLSDIQVRLGGALDFWTVRCLSHRELGDPLPFVTEQASRLAAKVAEASRLTEEAGYDSASSVGQEMARIRAGVGGLRDVFAVLARLDSVPADALNAALNQLRRLWDDLHARLAGLERLLPELPQLRKRSAEQESYFRGILDNLPGQFAAGRPADPAPVR